MPKFERMNPAEGEDKGDSEAAETTSEHVSGVRAFARRVFDSFSDRYPFGPISGPVNPADGKLYNLLRAFADDSPAFNPNNRDAHSDAIAAVLKNTTDGLSDLFTRLGSPEKAFQNPAINSAYELLGPPPEDGDEHSLHQRAYECVQATPPEERTEPGWPILEGLAEEYDPPKQ